MKENLLILILCFIIRDGEAIKNGKDAPPNIAPYRVSLRAYNDNGDDFHISEGSIISENKVLANAFNINGRTPDNLTVVVGLNSTTLPPQKKPEENNKNDISSVIAKYTEYFSCIIANALVFPHRITNYFDISKYLNPSKNSTGNGQSDVSSVIFYSCDVLLKEEAPSGPQRHKVASIVVHENFNGTSFKNDIGLIYIADTFKFSDTVQPISLATTARQPGDKCFVVSGGALSLNGTLPTNLQIANTEIITLEECNRQYSHAPNVLPIDDADVCVTYERKDEGGCVGDGGAPLVNNNELIGIVSFGIICGRGYPDVYTNVSYYIDWINNH